MSCHRARIEDACDACVAERPSRLWLAGMLAAALTSVATAEPSTTSSFCGAPGWKVVWRDEFDDATSPLPNPRWWKIEETKYPPGSSNADCRGSDCDLLGSCRDAACTADNVKVRDGRLVLTSQRQQALGRNYTTGAVNGRDLQTWRASSRTGPFRLCVSAILPGASSSKTSQAAAGVWPAHWLMPNDDSCDPDHGEMDVTEMVDGDGNVYSTYHWQDKGAPACAFPNNHSHVYAKTSLGPNWNQTLHEFAVERGVDHVAFALDGKVVLNATRDDPDPARRPVLSDAAWYLILNTAIGGGWPGPATRETQFPITHEVDYVRVAHMKAP